MFFEHIHHTAVNASNYEKTVQFYVNILGFSIIRENKRPEKNDIKLDLQLGNQELEVFVSDVFPERPSYPEALGLRHLAFKVVDVPKVCAYLESKGVVCEPIRTDDFTGERMTFFFDPDGLPLEIHE
ncbi:VOC family protein [Enterococcus sp. BWB1-3]|uniref:SMU1112c/YaeR family gloxylase I-like metalloprotein n=1 Tax=unclassified Enterococcus TaxID=2608891 RepID=UPI001922C636|nr:MULTISPECIES: VOC family protein [unclassified Enterococcus]MBL1227841.1 VOC family protein [Enterococcus sp. BWB1-3]MCB5956187.1 VOC family protein [Enterococcus sp. CWB-B31]